MTRSLPTLAAAHPDLACDYCHGPADVVILPTADYPVASPRCARDLDTWGATVTVGADSSTVDLAAAIRIVDDGTEPDETARNLRIALALQSTTILADKSEPQPHASYVDDVDAAAALAADVDTLVSGARHSGGATVWVGEEVSHGYLVGLPGRGIEFASLASIDADAVGEWLYRAGHLEHAATVGSWVAADTGRVYFDVCSHYAHDIDASNACRARGELAYWDVAAAREVRVNQD